MSTRLFKIITSLFLLLSVVSAMGQTPSADSFSSYEKEIVKNIEVRYIGPRSVDAERIRANMRTQVGAFFSSEVAEEDVRGIYAAGLAENVRILTRKVAGGLNVVVEISASTSVRAIEFVGNENFSDQKLRSKSGLRVGSPVSPQELQEAREAIQAMYVDRGYPDVRVDAEAGKPDEQGFSTLSFNIQEGDRVVIRQVRFRGNQLIEESKLKGAMKTKKRGIFYFLSGSGWVVPEKLEEDRGYIEDYYREQGYLDARVVEFLREPVDGDRYDLIVVVDEGKQYQVDSVHIEGLKEFSLEELVSSLKMKSGTLYNDAYRKDDESLLRQYYGSRGYANARVFTRSEPSGQGGLRITYVVSEGQTVYLRKINIEGNDKTKDKVIRREIIVNPGDEYNTIEVEASRKRLLGMDYFSNVEFLPRDTGTGTTQDLDITVTEKETGRFDVGAGFSSIDNVVGRMSLTQRNFDLFKPWDFVGGGQRFSMELLYGTKRRDFLMKITEPWFMDMPLAVGGEIYYRDNLFLSDDYDERRIGGALFARKKIRTYESFKAEYRLQQVEIHDIDNKASAAIKGEEGDFLQSSINFEYAFDNTSYGFGAGESYSYIEKGTRVSLGGGISGEFLGGDVNTYKLGLSAKQYIPFKWSTVLSLQGDLQIVDTLGGSDSVPIFERLFLGGANTLRGFDYRDVGPKDEFGEPLGGQTAVNFSAEYTFPLIPKIRGAVFYDVGFVNKDSSDFDTGDVNSNYGVGLRLFLMPGGPIRIDFGIPIDADEYNDSNGKFNFSAGFNF